MAFGNFEFGASAAGAGYALGVAQGGADFAHGGSNNWVNQRDINSGFGAISSGGQLSVFDYGRPQP